MQCNNCSHTIDRKSDRFTMCEGKCAKRYHAACVGLSESSICALSTNNVIWMCDDCLLDFRTTRDALYNISTNSQPTITESIQSDVLELKAKVEEILLALGTTATVTPERERTEKRSKMVHSTPVIASSRGALMDGTKINRTDDTNESGVASMIRTDSKDMFSLFMSNIEPYTAVNDIDNLVRDCLEIRDSAKINIRKIIPKGRVLESLEYVSFKISVNSKYKSKALKPCTWPIGIKFREFESQSFVCKVSE